MAYVSPVSATIIVRRNGNSSAYQSFVNWPIFKNPPGILQLNSNFILSLYL